MSVLAYSSRFSQTFEISSDHFPKSLSSPATQACWKSGTNRRWDFAMCPGNCTYLSWPFQGYCLRLLSSWELLFGIFVNFYPKSMFFHFWSLFAISPDSSSFYGRSSFSCFGDHFVHFDGNLSKCHLLCFDGAAVDWTWAYYSQYFGLCDLPTIYYASNWSLR